MFKKGISKRIIFISLALCLILTLLLFACEQPKPTPTTPTTPAKPTGPQTGGIVKIGFSSDVASTLGGLGYPPQLQEGLGLTAGMCALEHLTKIDKDGTVIPWLAEKWVIAPDQKSITFSLKKGVKFHDGSDFNAEVVKWNVDKMRAGRTSNFMQTIQSVDAVDDSTVRFNLSKWDNTLLGNMAVFAGPIISKAAYDKNGEDYCVKNPIGTGPFKFVSWTKDVKINFVKNPDYWQKGKPYLDGVEFDIIADSMVMSASFKRGEIDAIFLVDSLTAKDLETTKTGNISKFVGGGSGIVWDSKTATSPYAKAQVRQAIEYAVDKDAICKSIGLGYWIPSYQIPREGSWAYSADAPVRKYDPTKAKQLMAEAGYPTGFKTRFLYMNTPAYNDVVVAYQSYLKAIGIDVELVAMTGPAYIEATNKAWDNALTTIFGTYSADDLSALVKWDGPGMHPWTSRDIPQDYQDAIAAATTGTEATMKALTQKAVKMGVDQCVSAWMYKTYQISAVQAKVNNLGMPGVGGMYLWTPWDCWISK
jgi:peptide/nickel transport system substrate-binding protein